MPSLAPRLLLGLAFAAPLSAQVVPPAAANPAPPADPVVLSPFVVDTSGDRGYFASSTLAASRLKTDLKDIASSVSVTQDPSGSGNVQLLFATAGLCSSRKDAAIIRHNSSTLQ